jgi:photosystem II stability/assembly factor-like uncharacterized protein
VSAVSADAGGHVWLAISHARTVDVYRRGPAATGWTRQVLSVSPGGYDVGGAAPTVAITPEAAGLLTIEAFWILGNASAYSDLFVSADDGSHFSEHPYIGLHLGPPVFVDQQHGVVVAGPASTVVDRTSDGGASWRLVPPPGLTTTTQGLTYGPAAVVDGDLEVVASRTSDDGAQQVWLDRSTDGGATFAAIEQPPLSIPAAQSDGDVPGSFLGDVVWLIGVGRIYRSSDGGRSWRTVPTTVELQAISVLGAQSAIGVAGNSACAVGKSQCSLSQYLVRTSDGGQSWHRVS